MSKLLTIIGFTFRNKTRTKSFIGITLLFVALITIGMNIPYLVQQMKGEKAEGKTLAIGVVVETGNQAAERLLAFTPPEHSSKKVTLTRYASVEEAAKQAADSDDAVKGYLVFDQVTGEGVPPVTYYSLSGTGKMDDQVRGFLEPALQKIHTELIAGDKLTPEQLTAMQTPVPIQVKAHEPSGDGTGSGADEPHKQAALINYVVVYLQLFLFFLSIMLTGNMIAAEVTAEKSSRIMELLITSSSPLTQMFGKVIGIFLVGLMQVSILAATLAANLMLPHNKAILGDYNLELGTMNMGLLFYGIALYILGFFLYALMYAAVGSLISRTEELGQATMPIMFLGFAALYIPAFSMQSPDSLLVKIASFVPFTSPLTMLLRIGIGQVALWEIAVSLLLLFATIAIFALLAARIYRTGVLLYGKRPNMAELRKAMKAYYR